jgi:protein-S-isoprenylcysteine O-methyltransferase Ste14
MSLTSEHLVGYLRAEYRNSGRIRVWLFFVQFLAAIPAAVSVVIPDHEKVVLYGLAIAAVALLIAWWVLNEFYVSAKSAAQAARRGALLLGGLSEPLSPSEIQSLRERFTVTSERARKCEKADYYATKEPSGPSRLAEMIEESALFSEHLQRKSGHVMLGILLLFAFIFLVFALVSISTIERDTGMVVARVILALMVFVLSADVLGAWRLHRTAMEDIKQIRNRLMVADRAGYPMPDVLLAFVDYNSAVEGCPESVPFVYSFYQKELEQRWNDYQADRATARARWRSAAK